MPLLNPSHLLEQADVLLSTTASGAPRQADLRRSISGAYYAVFHAIATEAADVIIGRANRTTPAYRLVYRTVDHKSLRDLCASLTKSVLPLKYASYAPHGGFGSDLVALSAAVVELQEKRHLADYDPLFRARLSDAQLAVRMARDALERLERSARSKRKAFCSLLLFSPRHGG